MEGVEAEVEGEAEVEVGEEVEVEAIFEEAYLVEVLADQL